MHILTQVKALAKREARILQTIDHVNCIKLLDAFKSKTGRVYLVRPFGRRETFPLGCTSITGLLG